MTSITPTVAQVSALERSRTVDQNGNELGVFTSETRPSDTEVLALAAIAESMMDSQPSFLQTQAIVALLTAMLIEQSYFRDTNGALFFRDMLMRMGFIIRVGGTGGDPVEERNVSTVMMRPGMTEYDPYYPKPIPVPDWPYPGANT